jgi:voltage-gated potassium channel
VDGSTRAEEPKNSSYGLFIGALLVLSLVNLALFYPISDENLSMVIFIVDGLLSLIFMVDFLCCLFTAEFKSGCVFRRLGWAGFLANVLLPQLNIQSSR